jgi:hypothetical protein
LETKVNWRISATADALRESANEGALRPRNESEEESLLT